MLFPSYGRTEGGRRRLASVNGDQSVKNENHYPLILSCLVLSLTGVGECLEHSIQTDTPDIRSRHRPTGLITKLDSE